MTDERTSIMEAAKVEELISSINDLIGASGCNLLEAHQALKSLDAVVVRFLRERLGDKAVEMLDATGPDGDGA